MFVSVAAYENAILNWRIIHDAQKANDHLFVEGKPPESLERIQPEELARVHQDLSVDFIFEIPLRVAKELVGFRHEEATGVFEILREISPTKARPRWKFW